MALKEFIQRNEEEARLIFTKLEIEIIKKQIEGINLKQSERNTLSKSIRKKLEFIQKISIYKNEFKLKKNQENIDIIKYTKEIILNYNNIKTIYLFGSYVEGKFTKDSDIDIAVEFTKISEKNATNFLINVKSEISEKVDLSVYNFLPKNIKNQITENGRKIYQNLGQN